MIEDHLSAEQLRVVEEELMAENKIEAIKQVREFTNLGLKEAKDLVDEHIKGLMERDPEKYGHLLSRGGGCFGALLLISLPPSLTLLLFL